MKPHLKIALIISALTLAAALPAFALGSPPEGHGNGHGPHYTPEKPEKPTTPGPKAPLPEKANAYGVYCRGESKQHVKGEKGTPFSQCVTAMAKAANNKGLSPGQACKGMSKKHVKGQKRTPFSQCVTAAAKLRKAQHT
jgi:hypothetical protein